MAGDLSGGPLFNLAFPLSLRAIRSTLTLTPPLDPSSYIAALLLVVLIFLIVLITLIVLSEKNVASILCDQDRT